MRRIFAVFGTVVVLWLVILLTLFRSSSTPESVPLADVAADVNTVGPVQRLRRLQKLKMEAAHRLQAEADASATAEETSNTGDAAVHSGDGGGDEIVQPAAGDDTRLTDSKPEADDANPKDSSTTGAGGDGVAESTERGSSHCQPWCVSPCAELNGNVYDECHQCGAEFRCRPGAEGMPTAAEASKAKAATAKATAPEGGAAAEEGPAAGQADAGTEDPAADDTETTQAVAVEEKSEAAVEPAHSWPELALDESKQDPTAGDVVLLTANGRVRLLLQQEAFEVRR